MKKDIANERYTCLLCGGSWKKGKQPPKRCYHCSSRNWNNVSLCLCGCGKYVGGHTRLSRKGHKVHNITRFWAYVRITKTCWLWQKYCDEDGYGTFKTTEGKTVKAYHFAYESLCGPIPKGMVLDHLCSVRACLNPDHLEIVTPRENVIRGKTFIRDNADKTRCIRGHEFTPENTRIVHKSRFCRACCRERTARYRKRDRERANAQGITLPIANALRTHCPSGHPYNEENTQYDAKGWRKCRTCNKKRKAEAYQRNKAIHK